MEKLTKESAIKENLSAWSLPEVKNLGLQGVTIQRMVFLADFLNGYPLYADIAIFGHCAANPREEVVFQKHPLKMKMANSQFNPTIIKRRSLNV